MSNYKTIKLQKKGRIAVVILNRPDSLNALNGEVMSDVASLFAEIDRNREIAVSVLTGEGKAFAAGADIKEMQPQRFSDMYVEDYFSIRLTKAIGKAKAMDLILTGRMIDGEEADRIGLVSRVVAHDEFMTVALEAAETIAGYSVPSIVAAKEMIGRALKLPTTEGVRFERRLFQGLFGTQDQKEDMKAFSEKRSPKFADA